MPRPDQLHIAFLGCGRIAARHARLLGGMPGVSLSFASRSFQKAESYRRRFAGTCAFGSYDDAIAAPVDAVVVTTPPDAHLSLTLGALRAGRHVIVEKPAFSRSHDVMRVAERAAAANRLVMVAENYHYKPLTKVLRELVDSGVVGTTRLVQIDAVKRQLAAEWLGEHASLATSALFEGGIHWLHLLASLGLGIDSVVGYRAGKGGAERTTLVVAHYTGGAIGTLFHSWETPSPLRGLRMSHIYGTDGVIAFESNGLFVRVNGKRSRVLLPGLRDIAGYRAMFGDFLASLRHGREPAMTLRLAYRDLELVEAAYRCLPVEFGRVVA